MRGVVGAQASVASTATAPELSPAAGTAPRAWWGVAAAMFAIAWGGNEFTPLLVMYKNHGLSVTTVDVLLFDYVLGIVPALLIGGPLSDRYGRRRLMCPAPLIAGAGSLLLAAGAESVAVLSVGRVLSGVALGLAMAVGGSWVKELSQQPYSAAAVGTGARRSAMSLTAGFALGAGIAGALAQWAPWPNSLAYLVNLALCLAGTAWVARAPETLAPQENPGRLIDDLKVPVSGHRRFRGVALPVAVWVFASVGTSYAVLPTLLADQVRGAPIAFSALLTVLTLGTGFALQSMARRIDRPGTARTSIVALILVSAGMVVAAVAAATLTLWVALVAALILGAGNGMGLVAGLQEIERLAEPGDLAGLTAVFYSVSYIGFGLPALLAFLHQAVGAGYPWMLGAGALVAIACLAVVVRNYRVRG
ncbi:MFS transporter [Nocardia sp. BMG51109]|uniref:MFS transporter n=1 Tax=Nocardia sp. BMG51109 TaxID=1056816 RepID=UPI0009FD41DB